MRQGISPTQLFAMLWARRQLIVACTVLVAAAAVLVSKFVLPKTWEATATLQFDFEVYDPTTGKDFPAYLAQSYMSTQVDILRSPATLRAAVERLGWAKDPKWTKGFKADSGASLEDYLVHQMNKRLKIGSSRDSRLVDISFRAEDPNEAARVANTIAEVYLAAQIRARVEPTRQLATEYSEQLRALREEVEQAQRALSAFRQQRGLIDLDQRADVEARRLEELNRKLVEAEAELAAAQSRARLGPGERELLESTYIQNLKSELAALEAQRARLAEQLGVRHPQLVALDEQIAALRERLGRESGGFRDSVRREAVLARRKVEELRAQVAAQRQRVLEAQAQADEAAMLVRRLQSAEKLYNAALERYERILLGSRSGYTNVRIVNRASAPLLPASPKTRVNAVLGVIAGGLLGLALALVLELIKRRVRCREDVERELGWPVLAEIGSPR